MAKGDLRRQYSLGSEVAGQAQSFTVIESCIKPLTYLCLYLFWLLVEHSVIVWNSNLIRYLTLKITIRTFSKRLLLIFWCICACVAEISLSIVCICAVRIVLYALDTVSPAIALFTFVDSSVHFLAFASLYIMSSDLDLPAFNSLQIACFRSSCFTLLNFNI